MSSRLHRGSASVRVQRCRHVCIVWGQLLCCRCGCLSQSLRPINISKTSSLFRGVSLQGASWQQSIDSHHFVVSKHWWLASEFRRSWLIFLI